MHSVVTGTCSVFGVSCIFSKQELHEVSITPCISHMT